MLEDVGISWGNADRNGTLSIEENNKIDTL
jgi:hypothetical protein